MASIGTIIDDKYKILTEVGRGGMSVVYLAMDTHLNKQWAVKEITKKGKTKTKEIFINSLLVEANLMKRLDHIALPRIVDIIERPDVIYVVMDYIEGESLDIVLKTQGAQPEELVIEWSKQLCDALSYLHRQNPPIIYRDMKPANVMLKPEGTIKIIDFGIAREYKEDQLQDTTILGTKGYAPPEQYVGQTDVRSDIFALGMTMHHLLTGIDPRTEAYAPVRSWKHSLSEGVELIIDKCVNPSPEHRYQSCEDLLYDLNHPDLITSGYKKRQKRKLNSFIATATLTAVFLTTGISTKLISTAINNSEYESLISHMESTSLESKVDGYMKAIEIYPSRTDAYSKLMEAYESEGVFSKKENDEFMAVYNVHKDSFDKSSVEYANLNYQIGMMYFNYYVNEDGSVSLSNRVQKANAFFADNFENENISPDFEYKTVSDCYYRICYFYKKYILNNSTVEEASREDYESLFETINNAVDSIDGANAYDQLSLYNGVFMLMYDQRISMNQVGVKKNEIISIMDSVYSKASSLTVQKEQSKKLQSEIIDNYQEYKSAIDRTYNNVYESVESNNNLTQEQEND